MAKLVQCKVVHRGDFRKETVFFSQIIGGYEQGSYWEVKMVCTEAEVSPDKFIPPNSIFENCCLHIMKTDHYSERQIMRKIMSKTPGGIEASVVFG